MNNVSEYPPKLYGGIPPHVDQDTSIAAAISMLEGSNTLRARVFRHIRENGGATDEELQQELHMGANTERPRRRELVLLGVVEDTGERRPLASGRMAIVWRAIQANGQQLELL